MVTSKARFDGRVLVPEGPVDLPIGCDLEISVRARPPPPAPTTLAQLAALAEQFPANPDLPWDLVAQHDHYLYGTSKRP